MGLAVSALTKGYGGKTVLDAVDLSIDDGEIHALLGPNGSGKSTLIRCLSGAARPDAGRIAVGGEDQPALTPRAAMAAGISVIYQHFSLIPILSVADNVFLGDEIRRGTIVDTAAQERETERLLARFGRPISPGAPVSSLSVGDRQLVEIAKALRRRPRVLILDEPTAALGEIEAQELGQQLQRLRGEGLAILYVTHLLSEVFAIADRVSVLRDGRIVLAEPVAQLDAGRVIAAISPAAGSGGAAGREPPPAGAGAPALELDGVVVDGVGPASVSVRRGEVVGIFGLLGSGRTELLEGVFGRRRPAAGTIRVGGAAFSPRGPADAIAAGVVLVAGDRLRQSIFDKLTALDNMVLPHVRPLGRLLARNPRAETAAFARVAAQVGLKPRDPGARAWALSGGNQQKLAVGRWLVRPEKVEVLMLDEPTQGIDVGARRDLYRLLAALAREQGKAILFTSSDPEETLALADRVIVLHRGRIAAGLERSELTEPRLLALAHGAAKADAA